MAITLTLPAGDPFTSNSIMFQYLEASQRCRGRLFHMALQPQSSCFDEEEDAPNIAESIVVARRDAKHIVVLIEAVGRNEAQKVANWRLRRLRRAVDKVSVRLGELDSVV
jgi:hypothetical protein